MTDDQTVDSLPFMPYTQALLGGEGATFTNYHAVQPLCCPSRASFLTGQYPHNHGVLNNLPPFGYDRMNFRRTIYTALDKAGYRTGWIGKVLNDPESHGTRPEPGFDEWLVPLGLSEVNMTEYSVSDNGTPRTFSGIFQNDFYASRARSFLTAANDAPFMLTLALSSPHWSRCSDDSGRCPPAPATPDLGTFEGQPFPLASDPSLDTADRATADEWWARELESVQSVDRIVFGIVDLLRRTGDLANTYIVLQSDNGMLHGEHDVFDKNVPWDRSVRVPLIIRGPGFDPGTVRSDLTANVDVPATILEAAGVEPPRPLDGYSLLGGHRRGALLLERLNGSSGASADQPWRQIKTERGWTYWREQFSGRRYLFDLDDDPGQLENLIEEEPKVAAKLNRRLNRMKSCANPCP